MPFTPNTFKGSDWTRLILAPFFGSVSSLASLLSCKIFSAPQVCTMKILRNTNDTPSSFTRHGLSAEVPASGQVQPIGGSEEAGEIPEHVQHDDWLDQRYWRHQTTCSGLSGHRVSCRALIQVSMESKTYWLLGEQTELNPPNPKWSVFQGTHKMHRFCSCIRFSLWFSWTVCGLGFLQMKSFVSLPNAECRGDIAMRGVVKAYSHPEIRSELSRRTTGGSHLIEQTTE